MWWGEGRRRCGCGAESNLNPGYENNGKGECRKRSASSDSVYLEVSAKTLDSDSPINGIEFE